MSHEFHIFHIISSRKFINPRKIDNNHNLFRNSLTKFKHWAIVFFSLRTIIPKLIVMILLTIFPTNVKVMIFVILLRYSTSRKWNHILLYSAKRSPRKSLLFLKPSLEMIYPKVSAFNDRHQ